MVDLGHQPGFALEPPPALIVLGELGLDQLEGAFGLEVDVPDAPDLAHAALADLLEQAVLAEDDLADLEDRRGQGVPFGGAFAVMGLGAVGSLSEVSPPDGVRGARRDVGSGGRSLDAGYFGAGVGVMSSSSGIASRPVG